MVVPEEWPAFSLRKPIGKKLVVFSSSPAQERFDGTDSAGGSEDGLFPLNSLLA